MASLLVLPVRPLLTASLLRFLLRLPRTVVDGWVTFLSSLSSEMILRAGNRGASHLAEPTAGCPGGSIPAPNRRPSLAAVAPGAPCGNPRLGGGMPPSM
jgi:hypothetical protein